MTAYIAGLLGYISLRQTPTLQRIKTDKDNTYYSDVQSFCLTFH